MIELQALIGDEAVVRLAEAFGGTRLYVPLQLTADHPIVRAVGIDAAKVLVAHYAPDRIKVPVARELRALHYRAVDKLTPQQIAVRLGLTREAVQMMFARVRRREAAQAAEEAQSSLF